MQHKPNSYNKFMKNEEIDGPQCTILWHVNDMKISNIDKKVIDWVIKQPNQRYDN